MEFRGLNY